CAALAALALRGGAAAARHWVWSLAVVLLLLLPGLSLALPTWGVEVLPAATAEAPLRALTRAPGPGAAGPPAVIEGRALAAASAGGGGGGRAGRREGGPGGRCRRRGRRGPAVERRARAVGRGGARPRPVVAARDLRCPPAPRGGPPAVGSCHGRAAQGAGRAGW